EQYELHPEDFGIELVSVDALAGKDGTYNAGIVREMLAGKSGPVRDAVLLNTAAGLTAYDKDATGHLFDRMRANMKRAEESIDSGAAQQVLDNWVKVSRPESE